MYHLTRPSGRKHAGFPLQFILTWGKVSVSLSRDVESDNIVKSSVLTPRQPEKRHRLCKRTRSVRVRVRARLLVWNVGARV